MTADYPIRLSTRLTPAVRTVFPLCAVAYVASTSFWALEHLFYGGSHEVGLADWLIGFVVGLWVAWYLTTLKEVFATEDQLIIHGLLKRTVVPFHQIAGVDEYCARGVSIVKVTLRTDGKSGPTVRYWGPCFRPAHRETPETTWLRAKINATR